MCSSCVSQPRRERSSNIQRAKELSVKNNAMSTAATSFVFVFFNVFFCASPTLVNFTVSLVSDLAHSSTNQHMNDAQRHTHWAICSWDFGGLHQSIFLQRLSVKHKNFFLKNVRKQTQLREQNLSITQVSITAVNTEQLCTSVSGCYINARVGLSEVNPQQPPLSTWF